MPRKRRRARLRDLFAPPPAGKFPGAMRPTWRPTLEELLDEVASQELDLDEVIEECRRSRIKAWRMVAEDFLNGRWEDV